MPTSSTVAAMSTPHSPSSSGPNDAQSANEEAVNLVTLSKATGVSVDVLRTFANISDPRNRHLFSAEAAQKAFSGVKL